VKPLLALLLCLVPAWSQVAKKAALARATPGTQTKKVEKSVRVSLAELKTLEQDFNSRLAGLAGMDEPVELMGDTRGVQLEDYGIVVTSEVSLVVTPGVMPGRPKIPPEMAARVRKARQERLPLLRATMTDMMRHMAMAFQQLPASQQLVLVVRLYYGAWEDTTGMPAQVTMKAARASAAAGKVETEER